MGYFVERAARDPDWRAAQIAGAAERERARREADPEGFRAAQAEASRRYRAKHERTGLTFQQLLDRSRREAGETRLAIGDPSVLAWVLRDELRRGRVVFNSTTRRYVLNGGLDEDVKQALRELAL